MRISDFDYALPPELIAQEPAPERTAARLLHLDRAGGVRGHHTVAALPELLRAGDLLVLNEARVVPARLRGRRPSGGRLEVLLLAEADGERVWDVMARGAPRVGETIHFASGTGTWLAAHGGGRWRLRLEIDEPVHAWLERVGEIPLPPYIRRPDGPTAADRERYQTTFARVAGAIAAPTAGLHLTPALLEALGARGVAHVALTLHVGAGTFLPIRDGDVDAYAMEPERYELPAETVARIAATKAAGGRVVAVGTTTVRALESAAAGGTLLAGAGSAALFVRPGHAFRVVDALLTNFHLPNTPLLALVAAFTGWDALHAAYDEAVRRRYRFYSYGDAMLIA